MLALHSINLLFCDKADLMFVHSSRILKQFEYLSILGIDTNPLYRQTGIEKQDLLNPDKTYDFDIYKIVLEFALRQTNNPHYGLDFGNQPQLGGTIGMMCASCSNIYEAFIQGSRFLQLQGDFAELKIIEEEKYIRLVYRLIDEWVIDSSYTAKLEIDAMFSFLNTIVKINSNNTINPGKISVFFQKPKDFEIYNSIFGIIPMFGKEVNEIVYDRKAMFFPMKAFNPEVFKVLNAHLKGQLLQLNTMETITRKVQRILYSSFKYQFPGIDMVADKLNISTRTLQRKLSDENTNFQLILQDAKFNIAKKLLKQNTLNISEISYTLGYSDIGNFSRSFKKYTGKSPQEYKGK